MCKEKALEKIVRFLKDGPKTREEIRVETGLTNAEIRRVINSNGNKLVAGAAAETVDLRKRKKIPTRVSVG